MGVATEWCSVDDRLSRVRDMNAAQLRAVIKYPHAQKTVRLAAERRLRKLAASTDPKLHIKLSWNTHGFTVKGLKPPCRHADPKIAAEIAAERVFRGPYKQLTVTKGHYYIAEAK